jgi:FkbM family methyltransferase
MSRADGGTVVGFAKLWPFVIRYVWRHPANRGRRAAAVTRALLALAWSKVTPGAVVVPIGEHSQILLRPRLNGVGSAKAVYGNPPDYYEMTLLRAVLEPGDLFVDVGANVGTYTIIAAECGAHVVAIEASTDVARQLGTNVRLNDIGAQVDVVHAAAGSEPGVATFSVGLDTLNHVLEPGGVATATVESVPVISLDELIGSRIVTAMKIDVEGFEAKVLAGAGRLLADQRIGYIQLENNASAQRHFGRAGDGVWDVLLAAGYTLFGLDPDSGVVVPASPDGTLTGREVLAVTDPSAFWKRVRDAGWPGAEPSS